MDIPDGTKVDIATKRTAEEAGNSGNSGIHWSKMFSSRSRFRHVFGSPASRDQCYDGIRVASSSTSHDATLCAVSLKYLAVSVESTGGGVFVVLPLNKTGRVDTSTCRVCGHGALINDMQWNPFNDDEIATCSDDTTIKLWTIPAGGLVANLTEWTVELSGHTKKVSNCQWHPSAADILLSSGHDFRCIVWNTRTGTAARVLSLHDDVIFCSTWNHNGSLFATTSKDGNLRVIEPRSGTIMACGRCHDGIGKTFKTIFVEGHNRLLTTGFSRTGERQYALWDANKSPLTLLKIEDLDSSSSIMAPFYDSDTHIVFLAGKGDGNIRYYEVTSDPPYMRTLNMYQSSSPQRDLAMFPKRGIDPSRGELARFYKIHAAKDLCEPVSMIKPSKTERFQSEIFPPTSSDKPALTAAEWLSGIDRDPILAPLADINDNALSRNGIKLNVTRRDDVTNQARANVTHTSPPEQESVPEVTSRTDFDATTLSQEGGSTTSGVFDMIRQFELISSSTDIKPRHSAATATISSRTSVTSSVAHPLRINGNCTNTAGDDHVTITKSRDLQQTTTSVIVQNGDTRNQPEVEDVRWRPVSKPSPEDRTSTGRSSSAGMEQTKTRHVHFVEKSDDDVTNDDDWILFNEPPDDTLIRPSLIRRNTPAALPHFRPPNTSRTHAGTVVPYDTVDSSFKEGAEFGGCRAPAAVDRVGTSPGDVGVSVNSNGRSALNLNGPPTTMTTTTTIIEEQVRARHPVDHRDVLENYFKQLEEIKTLKEQLSYKDKKIRRLEDQLLLLRTCGSSSTSRDNIDI